MIRNKKLARSASDRALSKQKHALKSALGDRLVLVSNQRPGIGGNSQTCLCGAPVPKTLSDRWHDCSECGLSAPRDAVSANIIELIAFGTHTIARSPGWGSSDAQEAIVSSRESAAATGHAPVRVSVQDQAPGMASTFRDLEAEKRKCGYGQNQEATLASIKPSTDPLVTLARKPKSLQIQHRKHPDLSG